MKYKAVAAILFAGFLAFLAPRPASAAWSVSISYFQTELAPYGRWVSTESYGEIWRPTVVAAGWAPYVYGEWIYTDCGWTWVSYDPFGEAPFHYGTWVWVDPYGWCWEPGFIWGPAWVTWAYTDFYIGWAPLPPSFDITLAGYSGGPVTVAQSQYVFVPINQFVDTNVSTARVPVSQNATILSQAQKVTSFSVSGGLVHATDPPPSLVERVTGKRLQKASLSSHKLKPTTISAGGAVSGKRFGIVAPAGVRAAAKQAKASNPRVALRGAPSGKGTTARGEKSAATSQQAAKAVKEKAPKSVKPSQPEKQAARNAAKTHPRVESGSKPAAREARGHQTLGKENESKHVAPQRAERRQPAVAAAPPRPASHATERREKPSAPSPGSKHEGRVAASSPRPSGPPESRPAAPPQASQAHPASPQASQPHPGPRPEAKGSQSAPQPQGHPPAEKKKEKE